MPKLVKDFTCYQAGKVALTVVTAALSPALVLVAAPVLLTGAARLLVLA